VLVARVGWNVLSVLEVMGKRLVGDQWRCIGKLGTCLEISARIRRKSSVRMDLMRNWLCFPCKCNIPMGFVAPRLGSVLCQHRSHNRRRSHPLDQLPSLLARVRGGIQLRRRSSIQPCWSSHMFCTRIEAEKWRHPLLRHMYRRKYMELVVWVKDLSGDNK